MGLFRVSRDAGCGGNQYAGMSGEGGGYLSAGVVGIFVTRPPIPTHVSQPDHSNTHQNAE